MKTIITILYKSNLDDVCLSSNYNDNGLLDGKSVVYIDTKPDPIVLSTIQYENGKRVDAVTPHYEASGCVGKIKLKDGLLLVRILHFWNTSNQLELKFHRRINDTDYIMALHSNPSYQILARVLNGTFELDDFKDKDSFNYYHISKDGNEKIITFDLLDASSRINFATATEDELLHFYLCNV